MPNGKRMIRRTLYIALFLCTAWVSIMAYHQIAVTRSENIHDLSTWLSKKEIAHLIKFHGTDGLKITQDEVYIYRGEKWIPVLKRQQG
jgi:hypothetical protein